MQCRNYQCMEFVRQLLPQNKLDGLTWSHSPLLLWQWPGHTATNVRSSHFSTLHPVNIAQLIMARLGLWGDSAWHQATCTHFRHRSWQRKRKSQSVRYTVLYDACNKTHFYNVLQTPWEFFKNLINLHATNWSDGGSDGTMSTKGQTQNNT